MNTPSWYELLLLGIAAWSVFQLLAHDDLLDRPRRYVLRLGRDWQEDGDPVPDEYREKWALFLTCPFCAGFWIWLAWLAAYWIEPGVALPAACVMAGRALVVAGHKVLAKEEDKTTSPDAAAVAEALERVGSGLDRLAKKP